MKDKELLVAVLAIALSILISLFVSHKDVEVKGEDPIPYVKMKYIKEIDNRTGKDGI